MARIILIAVLLLTLILIAVKQKDGAGRKQRMVNPKYIILHHSKTDDSGTLSWPVIREYHKSLGWNDIGYHYGIEMVRGSYEILIGRFDNEEGAHCYQDRMNTESIGICLIGDFDKNKPGCNMWEKALDLVRYLQNKYSIPRENVHGHFEHNRNKSCPGSMFDMDLFRSKL